MRLQRANRVVSIFVASFSLASVACVLVSGYFRHRQTAALNARTQSLLLSIQLANATDKLTAAARGFAATGDPHYREAFLREVDVGRSRDRAVEGLQALGLTQEENELISRAKRSSDALIAQEEKSFEAAERKDFTKAMGYVYGEEYLKSKALIMDPIDEFRRRLDGRLAGQALSEEQAAQRSVNLAIVASVLNALATLRSATYSRLIHKQNGMFTMRWIRIRILSRVGSGVWRQLRHPVQPGPRQGYRRARQRLPPRPARQRAAGSSVRRWAAQSPSTGAMNRLYPVEA